MDQRQKNKFMLAATLLMLAATVFLITRNEQFIFRDEGRLEARLDPNEQDTVVFYWRSEVEVPMARRYEEAFAEWGDRAGRIILDLHSPGGAIAEGEQVIRIIERMKHTHIVDTRVRRGYKCYSMCVPIFLMGEQRMAGENAIFMFHEPTVRDFHTDEEVRRPELEKNLTTRRFVDRYFANSPINPSWLEGLLAEWKGRDVFRSARDLVEEESGIVTELE
ncbi:ATP-dependent Clp protease proteolytic subunit [Hyphococcus flavus]|uniref:ATP-dependent Clp protease proteolytic subunit n=1 Tax=Hyphococcus flavus TaxID=1866326 RepID=A0AAF0CGG2_9PROT|nr:ATP-dependent Clp protease proteolytic subunit [Hyphococcus flavus]WDI30627.1 ATP-dependent Clp protease proteolytic subunit [Hyphococcus flavus]